ncbi:MAG: alpha/beta hydrolase [Spongiibacteraceae bacterium]|jgi:pimeloyl-ACP methyl ester carboxylesterase|nr:alpha/beta hydrolase [Spongiibacteraceae bacterium]
MNSLESKFVTTLGYQTHYIEKGEGEPLLLIHGGGAGADARGNWVGPCMDILAEKRRVIAYDMVGFGSSDAPDPETFDYGPETRVDQLIAFIEALGYESVDIIGNSMGGRTAAAVCIRRPELVRNLILMGSAGLDRGMGGALRALVEYDFTYEGMKRIVEALTNDNYVIDPKMVQYRLEVSLKEAQRKAFAQTMKELVKREGLHLDPDDIATIKQRTLVVNGKNDKVVPMEQGYRYMQLIENSTGVFLPNCGHWAMIEHPQKFAHIALEFLEGRI